MKLRECGECQRHSLVRFNARKKVQQFSRAIAEQDSFFVHLPQLGERSTQPRRLAFRIVRHFLDGASYRIEYTPRGSERVDACAEVQDIAPIPSMLAADLEKVATMCHGHRMTP